jgi:hypothetical protein
LADVLSRRKRNQFLISAEVIVLLLGYDF